MRKFLFTVILGSAVLGAGAQKLDDVQKDISKEKYEDAKEKIDKILSNPKEQEKANNWYYKGKVYAALAQRDTANTLGFDASKEAFEAYKKYQQLDEKNTLMLLDQNVGLFQLYDMYYNRGVRLYNDKNYEQAYNSLKNAMEVEDYVSKKGLDYNGFRFPALDTQLVNLTATSAYLAKKQDESIPYFEKLADARLSAKEYKEVYGLLAEHHLKAGNKEKADKYLTLGKELFPDEDYWISLEFGNVGDDKAKRLERYEQMTQKYPDNYALAVDYAIELYNHAYSNEEKPADYKARTERAQKALEQALKLNPEAALPNYVMSQHVYNQIFDLEDERRLIKGNTPAEAAKRKDFNSRIDKKYEEMAKFSQKAYDIWDKDYSSLKVQDKVNFRKTINQLIDYHQRKKQEDKVTALQAKLKTLK